MESVTRISGRRSGTYLDNDAHVPLGCRGCLVIYANQCDNCPSNPKKKRLKRKSKKRKP